MTKYLFGQSDIVKFFDIVIFENLGSPKIAAIYKGKTKWQSDFASFILEDNEIDTKISSNSNPSDSDDSPVKKTNLKPSRRRGLAARLKTAQSSGSNDGEAVSNHAKVYSTKVSKMFGTASLTIDSMMKKETSKKVNSEIKENEPEAIPKENGDVVHSKEPPDLAVTLVEDDDDDDLPSTPKFPKTTVDVVKSPSPPPEPPVLQTTTKKTRLNRNLKKAISQLCDARDQLITEERLRVPRPEGEDVLYVGDDDDTITVRVIYRTKTYRFPMREGDMFNKIFEEMAKKLKVESSKVLFLLNDQSISSHDSPKSIGLSTADIIYCHIGEVNRSILEDDNDESNLIQLYLQSRHLKHKQEFKISKYNSLDEIIRKYAIQNNIDPSKLRLKFDGEDVCLNDTPDELDLEDGYCLDIIHLS